MMPLHAKSSQEQWRVSRSSGPRLPRGDAGADVVECRAVAADSVRGVQVAMPYLSLSLLVRLCNHFLHALEVMAPRHEGIGSDFGGVLRRQETIPEGVAGLRRLLAAPADRGVNDQNLVGSSAETCWSCWNRWKYRTPVRTANHRGKAVAPFVYRTVHRCRTTGEMIGRFALAATTVGEQRGLP